MENITSKISKLLSLATSSNEHEAKLAADKANELMIRYNLSMMDIKEESHYDEFIIESGVRTPMEVKFLTGILNKHFFVSFVNCRVMDTKNLKMIGEKVNLENARYIYSFLKNAFEACWQAYRKETGCAAGLRQTYYLGLYRGLNEKLTATRVKVEQEAGLVCVPDKGVDAYIASNIGRTRAGTRARVSSKDASVCGAGQAAGSKMTISKGVSNKSNNVGYLT